MRNVDTRTPHPLKEARALRGWSQEELSRRTSLSIRTIVRIEGRLHQPNDSTQKLIATVIGMDRDDLFAAEQAAS